MAEIATEQNSTIILPVPIDLLRPFLEMGAGSSNGHKARVPRDQSVEDSKPQSAAPEPSSASVGASE
jgi:hypothetical protein